MLVSMLCMTAYILRTSQVISTFAILILIFVMSLFYLSMLVLMFTVCVNMFPCADFIFAHIV